MPPCLRLSDIRYGSRVKWSNPRKGVALPLHLSVVAIKKGAFGSPLTKGRQLYLYFRFPMNYFIVEDSISTYHFSEVI